MAKHPRLMRRGTVYHVRAKVPADIRSTYGKTEETWSLKTRDPREALKLVRLASVEIDQRFDAHRALLNGREASEDQILGVARNVYRERLQEFERHIARKGSSEDTEIGLNALGDDYDDVLRDRPISESVLMEIEEILKANGIWAPRDGILGRRRRSFAYDAIARAMMAAVVTALRRNEGDWDYVDGDVGITGGTTGQGALLLSEVFEKYLEDRPPSAGVLIEWRSNVARFIKLVGDKPITAITRADMRDYRDALAKLPGKNGKGTLAPGTIRKSIGSIGAILRWAEANGYADMVPNWSNPTSSIRVSSKLSDKVNRVAFDGADLKLLFGSPIWAGCRSEGRRKEPGNMVIKDHHFWLPLLALYMGARMEELGQSLIEDVKQDRGVDFLDINGDGPNKSLKTQSSWRKVPIHSALIQLGFLDYVGRLRASGETQLFPKLKQNKSGKYTAGYSKTFSRYKNAMGITDPNKVYHSFRHAFKEACRRAGVAEEVHDALTGHSGGGVGRTYGSMPLEAMAEAVDKVEYQTGL